MPRGSNEKTAKEQSVFIKNLIASCLEKLATAAGQPITEERKRLYCSALSNLSEARLKYAFSQTLENLGDRLPSIDELRTHAERYVPADPIAVTRRVVEEGAPVFREFTTPNMPIDTKEHLDRDDKPTDWAAIGRKSGISPEEIASWLEEGKQKQRAYYANLEADPAWQEEARRLGAFPGLFPKPVSPGAPKDPEERRVWTNRMAALNGWREQREPGEEG